MYLHRKKSHTNFAAQNMIFLICFDIPRNTFEGYHRQTYKFEGLRPELSPQVLYLQYVNNIIPLFFLFGNRFFVFIVRNMRQFYARQYEYMYIYTYKVFILSAFLELLKSNNFLYIFAIFISSFSLHIQIVCPLS